MTDAATTVGIIGGSGLYTLFPGADQLAVETPYGWHTRGMNRTSLSTTVDTELLESARSLGLGTTDATLVDEALRALLARHRSAAVDASYAVSDQHPVDEPDAWGDLASWRQAAAAS